MQSKMSLNKMNTKLGEQYPVAKKKKKKKEVNKELLLS